MVRQTCLAPKRTTAIVNPVMAAAPTAVTTMAASASIAVVTALRSSAPRMLFILTFPKIYQTDRRRCPKLGQPHIRLYIQRPEPQPILRQALIFLPCFGCGLTSANVAKLALSLIFLGNRECRCPLNLINNASCVGRLNLNISPTIFSVDGDLFGQFQEITFRPLFRGFPLFDINSQCG